jgi:tetratricopeptide (TPR) repeat protein
MQAPTQDNILDSHAKRLAKRLAGLPLALATAGTYLQRNTLTFERYLQEYEKRWDIDPRRPTKLQEYRDRTLYTIWDLSYARLEIEDPDAAQLLKVLAYFGNQSLWYELFHDGLTKESPEWLRELVADDVSFQGVMGILTEYYFLEVHLTSESWSMHNCVHDWTLAALNKNVDIGYYWYAFDCVHATVNGVNLGSLGHITFSRSASHVIQLVHQRFLENDMIYHPAPDKLDQVSRVSQLLQNQIQLAAAERMYLRALTGYEKALGPNHTSTLETVHNLGSLYYDQNKVVEAEQMYMRALARYEKALGPNDTATLTTVLNLGNIHFAQGKLDVAKQMYIRALAGCEKALGPVHTSTLDVINTLELLYCDQDKLDEAEQMYMRALAGYGKALGPDHASTLIAVLNLGVLYRGQDKLDEAEQLHTRALAGYEKALGPEHTATLKIVCNLGNLYCDQDKLEEAEQFYMRALAGYEKALGPVHTSTLDVINTLELLYRDQGKLDEAEQMSMRAGSRKKIE